MTFFGELAEFVADKVLPEYGPAIYEFVAAGYDPKGKGPAARRLKLMHRLDPAKAEAVCAEALESGSAETKIVALGCVGDQLRHAAQVLELTKARNQEVRSAALMAAARLGSDDALKAIEIALKSDSPQPAAEAVRASGNPRLAASALQECQSALDALLGGKIEGDQADNAIDRMAVLLVSIPSDGDAKAMDFLLRCFRARRSLAKIRGKRTNGNELNSHICLCMESVDHPRVLSCLADHLEDLNPFEITLAFFASSRVHGPSKTYDRFAPTYREGFAKNAKRAVKERSGLLSTLFAGHGDSFFVRHFLPSPRREVEYDPRWVQDAIALDQVDVVLQLARPGEPGVEAYLAAHVATAPSQPEPALTWLLAHNEVAHTDLLMEAIDRHVRAKKPAYHAHGLIRLVSKLKLESGLAKAEELVSKFSDPHAEWLVGAISEARSRPANQTSN